MRRRLIRLVLPVIVALVAAPALAVDIQGGWVRSDLGLDQKGDGFRLGIGERWGLGAGPFDVAADGAFARLRGIQPMLVSNPDRGLVTSDAEVTLTCAQAALSCGASAPVGPLRPRVYVGGAVSIKLDESWDRMAGDVGVDYAYEDVDVAVHLGLELRARGPLFVDVRWSFGLLEQVVVRDGSAAKALDDGTIVPEDGDKVSWLSIGLGASF